MKQLVTMFARGVSGEDRDLADASFLLGLWASLMKLAGDLRGGLQVWIYCEDARIRFPVFPTKFGEGLALLLGIPTR